MRADSNVSIDAGAADMKDLRECSINDAPNLDGDLRAYFDNLWHHLDRRERRGLKSNAARRKIRLGCTGELADIGSIGLVVIRESANGGDLIEFLCPRCERLHESVPFR
jgi:hypothetical protein